MQLQNQNLLAFFQIFHYNNRKIKKQSRLLKREIMRKQLILTDFTLNFFAAGGQMNKQNKLATMPVRPLLYTMAVPLMLSLLLLFELFLSLSHLPLRQSYAVASPLDLEIVSSIWLVQRFANLYC